MLLAILAAAIIMAAHFTVMKSARMAVRLYSLKTELDEQSRKNAENKALDMINKKDKQRQSYYNYYSSKKWGRSESYDLSVNSGVLGIDGTVKLIAQFVEDFENR